MSQLTQESDDLSVCFDDFQEASQRDDQQVCSLEKNQNLKNDIVPCNKQDSVLDEYDKGLSPVHKLDFEDDILAGSGWAVPDTVQRPFQPASSPSRLKRRYMVWNSVGVIRCYDTEEERTIEIEFHDKSTHRGIFMENSSGYSMGALSSTAAILACESTPDQKSKMECVLFSSWDNFKEWSVTMPNGETIKAVAVGEKFGAVCTDGEYLRIFTITGIQREVVSMPGPLVSMAAILDRLIIAYHVGAGFPGEQCQSALVLAVCADSVVTDTVTLPLTGKSTLSWIGFTDEGNACAVDSNGTVTVRYKCRGVVWTPIANTKTHAKGKSDNYFVVGVGESSQEIRCIFCKGAKYPPILPRPSVVTLPFDLRVCQPDSEKGKLEENYWRNALSFDTLRVLDADSEATDRVRRSSRENLIKLFALSCQEKRLLRACEIYSAMDPECAKLAARYANKFQDPRLLERLAKINQPIEDQEASTSSEKPDLRPNFKEFDESEPEEDNLTLSPEKPTVMLINTRVARTGCANPFKVTDARPIESRPSALKFFETLTKAEGKCRKVQNLQVAPVKTKRKNVSTKDEKGWKQKKLNMGSKVEELKEEIVEPGKNLDKTGSGGKNAKEKLSRFAYSN